LHCNDFLYLRSWSTFNQIISFLSISFTSTDEVLLAYFLLWTWAALLKVLKGLLFHIVIPPVFVTEIGTTIAVFILLCFHLACIRFSDSHAGKSITNAELLMLSVTVTHYFLSLYDLWSVPGSCFETNLIHLNLKLLPEVLRKTNVYQATGNLSFHILLLKSRLNGEDGV
jgi:hypothetical protein